MRLTVARSIDSTDGQCRRHVDSTSTQRRLNVDSGRLWSTLVDSTLGARAAADPHALPPWPGFVPLCPLVFTSSHLSFSREREGGTHMHILWALIIGLVAGALAKLFMPGKDPGGIVVTMLLGVAGSLVAGFLGRALGFYKSAGSGPGIIASIIGA